MSHRDNRPDYADTGWIMRWFFWFVSTLMLLTIIGSIFDWSFSWLSVPGQVTSVQNVREQWQFAYDYEASLKAGARQVCDAQRAVERAEGEPERIARRDHMFAYQVNYQRIKAEYDAALANAFEARFVKPPDVPDRAPSLEENMMRECSVTPMP